jgi:hypothetical protein
MGKYFGREPRYTREEIERQAQEAIDARVSLGRPPAEDWAPLQARLEEIDRALAARPAMPEHEPIQIHHVRLPKEPAAAGAAAPPAVKVRRPVAAQRSAD